MSHREKRVKNVHSRSASRVLANDITSLTLQRPALAPRVFPRSSPSKCVPSPPLPPPPVSLPSETQPPPVPTVPIPPPPGLGTSISLTNTCTPWPSSPPPSHPASATYYSSASCIWIFIDRLPHSLFIGSFVCLPSFFDFFSYFLC